MGVINTVVLAVTILIGVSFCGIAAMANAPSWIAILTCGLIGYVGGDIASIIEMETEVERLTKEVAALKAQLTLTSVNREAFFRP